jgi:hypothetical protein
MTDIALELTRDPSTAIASAMELLQTPGRLATLITPPRDWLVHE